MTQDPDVGYVAEAVGESIVTQGDDWQELCAMVVDATKGYFYAADPPDTIRLIRLKTEQQILAVA